MTNMLTAKDIQDLLQVDRSTVYRMAEAGRLPAIKVGKQWRFPNDLVESWLNDKQPTSPNPSPQPLPAPQNLADLLPLDCVQLILDTFADSLGVMLLVTDMAGQPITKVSHACGLFKIINQTPSAIQKCVEHWGILGTTIDLEPKFVPSHLGLLCARAFIRVGSELKGMLIIGGIAPDNWPPKPEQVQSIITEFDIPAQTLAASIAEVFYLDAKEQAKVLPFAQRIADILAHIVNEQLAA